jgi:hypothetical protein
MRPDKLTAIRADIARLQADRAAVVAAPDSRAEIIDYWRGRFASDAAGRVRSVAHHLAARRDGYPLGVAAPRAGEPLDLLPVLATLLGADHLIELLAPHFAALPDGLTHTERRQRLAELDAEINAAEHAEMTAVEDVESRGLPFTWRADQSPAVVLRLKAKA